MISTDCVHSVREKRELEHEERVNGTQDSPLRGVKGWEETTEELSKGKTGNFRVLEGQWTLVLGRGTVERCPTNAGVRRGGL